MGLVAGIQVQRLERVRRKPRIGLIAPGALNPPLQQHRTSALGLREESARREERSARSAAFAASGRTFELGCQLWQLFIVAVLALASCDRAESSTPLFELLRPEATGVTFVNELSENTELNILNYLYYYNGGGVAAGDIDNDGLPDLYFTSNLGSDRLYLNKGNYRFEDITERAGVPGPEGWTSGVTMADVNGDGYLDIYVSAVNYLTTHGRNVLYVNNGNRTFTDRTQEYGLEHAGYSTQAAFFDYDTDGDLDMYLLNHSIHIERTISQKPQREPRHPRAGDKLFRNDGNRFVDVSEKAGIHGGVEGYGLGVVASDLNLDGCPDVFVANDFQENDFLYLNNCDGTFTESIAAAMGHTSRFSMGVDAADYNNDGRPDLIVLDMLPEREEILKTSANAESFNIYDLKVKAGYHPQFARNTLQLNRGRGRFSEIGYLAGVYATDWSWSPLFADLDNDGDKDLFVTNGIYRRPNDLDYINYVSNIEIQKTLAMSLPDRITEKNLSLLKQMPQVPLASFAFRNNGDLTFTNEAEAWGLAQPGFSNGAVYVDLTNGGALDLVVSSVNGPARIYRSRARDNGHHYLGVRLQGAAGNTAGIGAKVIIVHGGVRQMLEQMPTRGFQSSVEPRLHFGLGAAQTVDSLIVIWPDRRFQVLGSVAGDRTITLSQSDATGRYQYQRPEPAPMFADLTSETAIDFVHRENTFFDYNREPFIPHRLSTEGPALAVGDVNGDGLDDVYVGGAKWQAGRLLVQHGDGTFSASNERVFAADSLHEDVDAAFFDANGDGHHDLYVVTGGNEFWGDEEPLLDRLYMNDGKGNFHRAVSALPPIFENGSTVAPGDFNGDGHVDLFVGTRVVARSYGRTPRSYLLQNDGSGRFVDVTLEKAAELSKVGMVSSAAWADYDGDSRLDLVVVGEWMPVRVFRQEQGKLVDRTDAAGLTGTNGWWNTVTATDLNADGRADLVLGNLGLNSYIRASRAEPARLYVHDFFENDALEQVLTFYKHGVSYPLMGRDDFVRTMPQLRSRYDSYAKFGASRIEDILPPDELKQATVMEAQDFATSIALNKGDGTFDLEPLPIEAQFAPAYAAMAEDFDGDGRVDLLLAGNFDGVTPLLGRYDASYGLLLRGNGSGRFTSVDLEESGLEIEGQVRDMKWLRHARGGRVIVVARNNDRLQVLRPLRGAGVLSASSGRVRSDARGSQR
jgi:enediyne biosynthesis protein E4